MDHFIYCISTFNVEKYSCFLNFEKLGNTTQNDIQQSFSQLKCRKTNRKQQSCERQVHNKLPYRKAYFRLYKYKVVGRLLLYSKDKGACMQVGQSIQDTATPGSCRCIQVEKQGLRLVKKAKKVFYEFLSTRSWMPKHICASIPLLGGTVQYLVLRPISRVHQGLLLS